MKRYFAAALLGTAIVGFAPSAMAAGEEFCHSYTEAALVQVRAAMNNPRCMRHLEGDRWSTDKHVHFDWCRNASRDQADGERQARKDYLDACR